MIIKSVFVANDGTEFTSADACYAYEQNNLIKDLETHVVMINVHGDQLNVENITEEFEDAIIFYSDSEHASQTCFNLLSTTYVTPWDKYSPKAGAWIYDEDTENWFSVGELKDYLQQIMKYKPNNIILD